jgi:hypothetical protein
LACSTVRDEHGGARGSAAAGGDVAGCDEVAVPAMPTVGALELSSGGLGDAPVAFGAGRGGLAFVDAHDADAGAGGFVDERAHQVSAPPGVKTPVLMSAGVAVGDPGRITDDQCADAAGEGPGDHRGRGFVVCLVDAAAMAGLGSALRGA